MGEFSTFGQFLVKPGVVGRVSKAVGAGDSAVDSRVAVHGCNSKTALNNSHFSCPARY